MQGGKADSELRLCDFVLGLSFLPAGPGFPASESAFLHVTVRVKALGLGMSESLCTAVITYLLHDIREFYLLASSFTPPSLLGVHLSFFGMPAADLATSIIFRCHVAAIRALQLHDLIYKYMILT